MLEGDVALGDVAAERVLQAEVAAGVGRGLARVELGVVARGGDFDAGDRVVVSHAHDRPGEIVFLSAAEDASDRRAAGERRREKQEDGNGRARARSAHRPDDTTASREA
jgi:hypothetical protein